MSARGRKTFTIQTLWIPFPSWSTKRQALDLLGNLYPAWVRAFEDVGYAGLAVPPIALLDLGVIAEALSDSIRMDHAVQVECIADEHLAEVAALASGYFEKVGTGTSVDSHDGVHVASARTLPLLCEAVERAARSLAEEATVDVKAEQLLLRERVKLVDRSIGIRKQLKGVQAQLHQNAEALGSC